MNKRKGSSDQQLNQEQKSINKIDNAQPGAIVSKPIAIKKGRIATKKQSIKAGAANKIGDSSKRQADQHADTATNASKKPQIKLIPMRNLEILVIGGPKSGKTTLIKQLLQLEEEHHDHIQEEEQKKPQPLLSTRVGMTVYKKEHMLNSGETIRMCVWDPALSILPKEQHQKQENQEKAQKAKTKGNFFHELIHGKSVWEALAGNPNDTSTDSVAATDLPYIEDFQKNTSEELAKDYLWSGTYHIALFVFDLTDLESFKQMELWFERFRDQCAKSSNLIHFVVVGTKLDLLGTTQEPLEENPDDIQSDAPRKEYRRCIENQVMEEWLDDLTLELEEHGQSVKYFEISNIKTGGGKIGTLAVMRQWILEKGLEKYRRVENKRYSKVVKEKRARECTVGDCRIF